MMQRLQSFFYGRYKGLDQFNIFLFIASFILSLFFRGTYLFLISYIPLAYAVFRMLSKNIEARVSENQKFLKIWYPVKRFFTNGANRAKEKSIYKFYKCPYCKTKIRVPRGRGKIRITCPGCKNKFEKRT